MKCSACLKPISDDIVLRCTSCKHTYHYICVNITSSSYRVNKKELLKSWMCPSCTNVKSRGKGDETPVRAPHEIDMSCDDCALDDSSILHNTSESPKLSEDIPFSNACELKRGGAPASSSSFTLEQLGTLLDSKLSSNKAEILSKLEQNKSEILSLVKIELHKSIEVVRSEFTATTDYLSQQLNNLDGSHSALVKRVKCLEQENASLSSKLSKINNVSQLAPEYAETIVKLRNELNDREQASLLNDIELTCIPEFQAESPIHVVIAIASKLGLHLTDHDIVSAERVGSRGRGRHTQDKQLAEEDGASRPRPIVVRLARRALRDELLRQARVRRDANTSDIGLPQHTPRRFYVNERLTKVNRIIFARTLQASRNTKPDNWKFVWTKGGKVFARRTATSTVHQLSSLRDVETVFGAAAAPPPLPVAAPLPPPAAL